MRAAMFMVGVALCLPAAAEEGLWTFENFPADAVEKAYGVAVTPEWLEHVRLSTVRLTNCTASFVSADGLILTNHHCIESCLAELSSKKVNLMDSGFLADERHDERRCETQIADVLVGVQEVTAAVSAAAAGLDDQAANAARRKTLTTLEQNCEQTGRFARSGPVKCQAVTLHAGGQYFLYRYNRNDDVRLVFAPEADIAAFGGDPDNFQFPRWSLDFSMLRAYESGRPAKTPQHLAIDFDGPRADQLVFVAGHPGTTSRLATRAQLEFARDIVLPSTLLRNAELRGRYIQYGFSNPANEQLLEAPLNNLENGIKVRRKLLDALHDDDMLARKSAAESVLRDRSHFGSTDPWQQIAAAEERERVLYLPYTFIEGAAGFNTILFRYARLLVRAAAERQKPNADRLREFTDAALPRVQQQLLARLPILPEVEAMTLSFSVQRMREWLGPDYPLVRWLLAHDSPESFAVRMIAETRLADPEFRKLVWDYGERAVDASHDPMLELARAVDGEARDLRKGVEAQVDAPIAAAAARIAAARFQAYGTQVYPDATFSLRLNYGTVRGWTENGTAVEPFTHLDRAFARATGVSPFKIPDRWLKVKAELDPRTPFCMATTNDIVGGNSGSPLIDARGRLVGLMFDGNIHSIAGDYWFDAARNRAVALHPAILRLALDKVYAAHALLAELDAR